MHAILIVELPTDGPLPYVSWSTFLRDVENIQPQLDKDARPAQNCFVLDLESASHILGTLVHLAVTYKLSYKMLFIENPKWHTWVPSEHLSI